MADIANIVCIKYGTKYPAHYVNRLYQGVLRNVDRPLRFICMTDDSDGIDKNVEILPLTEQVFEPEMRRVLETSKRQGALRKVALFRHGAIPDLKGAVLGFDLDVVITGSLTDLLEFEPTKISMRHDWLEKRRGRSGGHGSVFKYDPALHAYLFDDLVADTEMRMVEANCSEQKYTSLAAQRHGDMAYFPEDWVCSFKRDAMRMPPLNLFLEPKLPPDARVMCFHGNPKMEEAVDGYAAGPLRSTRPCRWLKSSWIGAGKAD